MKVPHLGNVVRAKVGPQTDVVESDGEGAVRVIRETETAGQGEDELKGREDRGRAKWKEME